jgi:hypothetical protein
MILQETAVAENILTGNYNQFSAEGLFEFVDGNFECEFIH